jgi:cytochrome P450/NADPH-cytochrome P450 reductase
MEPAVKRALIEIHRHRAGVDDAAAERWIEELGRQNRYVLDVWAGG